MRQLSTSSAHNVKAILKPRRNYPQRLHRPRSHRTQGVTQEMEAEYANWSTSQLLTRIRELEEKLEKQSQIRAHHQPDTDIPLSRKPAKPPKPFDPSKYATRLVALKFAYLGGGYNGLEHHVGNSTPLPTVEEELWKALVKTRLICPPSLVRTGRSGGRMDWLNGLMGGEVPVDWEGTDYSKCGRTDRGVSAFGQVIGIRLRSARPVKANRGDEVDEAVAHREVGDLPDHASPRVHDEGQVLPLLEKQVTEEEAQEDDFDTIRDELPYVQLLNRVLPPTIRMLAWCPSTPSNFSARFSCKERLYRYFFTNPAYLPSPGATAMPEDGDDSNSRNSGWLDIRAMREAASHLVGNHDFRNFCKVDPSKQLTNFTRVVTHASIDRVVEDFSPIFPRHNDLARASTTADDSSAPPETSLYAFTVRGSAFLWHQVRCMAAVLFLVGQGLEKPSVIQELLDTATNPRRPFYEMASDKPLVLWECTFSKTAGTFADGRIPEQHWDRGTGPDELGWIYAGEEPSINGICDTRPSGKRERSGIMDELWYSWRGAKIDEVLARQLMVRVAHRSTSEAADKAQLCLVAPKPSSPQIFSGGDLAESRGKYVPLMQREKLDTVEAINSRYLAKKGTVRREVADSGD